MQDKLWAYGLVLFSVPWLLVGLYMLLKAMRYIRHSVVVEGEVVDLNEHQTLDDDGRSRSVWAPVVEFIDVAERLHKFTSDTYSASLGKPKYSVGQKVKVRYLKQEPHEPILDSPFQKVLFPVLLFVSGGAFLVLGLSLFGMFE